MAATLTDTQKRALAAIMKADRALSADEIAARLGYRPARAGRLAVTRSLRCLLRPDSDVGEMIHRLGPRDRWGCAKWAVYDRVAAAAAVG